MAAAMCLPGSPRAINATVDGSRLVLINPSSFLFSNRFQRAIALNAFYAKQAQMGIVNKF